MQSSSPVVLLSPSFTTYSSGTLADIAARVVEEFRLESGSEFDDLYGALEENQGKSNDVARKHPTILEEEEEEDEEVNKNDDNDDDFEFPSVCVQSISADEIFCNGQIRPVFPVFGKKDVFFAGGVGSCGDGKANCPSSKASNPSSPIRVSLRSLMREERDSVASCSSSESSDELDGVPAETYCTWTPRSAAEAPERWRKSGSTGSSKRWRIRDLLLRRSNSDGRLPSVFLGNSSARKLKDERVSAKATTTEKTSFGGGEVVPVTAAQEEDYGVAAAASAGKEGECRRSSGRQDWVGFFTNVNGLSSNLHPF
ncbi:uncharacterized protein LOC131335844 [Rhododendron vialii]|uniref:uncharacterized protein LOC131335844 n=1 Tax=Rhododendron vialii TaxID=182163 RepID=UPI00265E7AA5|nr:uncharacterized protein LOC131335844 [Rhododendron vialii]